MYEGAFKIITSIISAFFKASIITLSAIFVSCNGQPVENSDFDFDYFGQQTPGNEAKIFAQEIVSKQGRFEMGFSISTDGNFLAYGVSNETEERQTAIHMMRRLNNTWKNLGTEWLNSNERTYFPMFSNDHNSLFFAKEIGSYAADLYKVYLNDSLKNQARPLSPVINSNAREASIGLIDETIYYISNREGDACCGDIFVTTKKANGEYKTPKLVSALSSDADEESLYVDPKGRYMIIQAWKNEDNSKYDLYISYTNRAGNWTSPERLSTSINTTAIEQRPFVTPDDQYLFFSRVTETKSNEGNIFESDIYWVSTAEVFQNAPFSHKN